jgi:hypothetical protein
MGRFLGASQFRSIPNTFNITNDVTSNITLAVNSAYFVNTTAGAITLTLPQSPAPGEFVDIFDAYGKFDTNNCIVNPSGDGSTVGGFADNLTINLARANVRLQYSANKNDWVVTQLL